MAENNTIRQLQVIFNGWAYLITGVSLIFGSLIFLGVMIDALTKANLDVFPELAQAAPLIMMFVSIGWGAYFIWKGIPGLDATLDVICRLADRVILNRVNGRVRILVGASLFLAGFISFAVAGVSATIGDAITTTIMMLGGAGVGAMLTGGIIGHGMFDKLKVDNITEKGKGIKLT